MALSDECVLAFCRITQLGLLRLLTTQSVMGQGTLTQAEAWQAYDRWIEAAGAEFADEPEELEPIFRSLSGTQQASPKEWADAYLAAFAMSAGLPAGHVRPRAGGEGEGGGAAGVRLCS